MSYKKKHLSLLDPDWNTATDAPKGKEHLNQDRLRKLEEARKRKPESGKTGR